VLLPHTTPVGPVGHKRITCAACACACTTARALQQEGLAAQTLQQPIGARRRSAWVHLEILHSEGGAREEAREDHVDRDLELSADVAVGELD
jgi:hypothetical protein